VPFAKERKNFQHALAEHFVGRESRDALHRAVPRNQAHFAVKREEAIDAGVDEST